MAKYKLTWKDLTWKDFKIYLFSLFKAFIPKTKISNLDELEDFIQSKSAWVTQVTLYGYLKTRSGKIMRRILRKIAANEHEQLGDTTTLADPSVVKSLVDNRKNI